MPASQGKKVATSFRLTAEAVALLQKLSEENGISQAAVVEMAVRKLAKDS